VASIAGWVEKSALLSLATMNVSACPASSAGPGLAASTQFGTVCGPVSSSTATSPTWRKPGASFTGLTVMVNVSGSEVSSPPLAVPPSSRRTTVTVATPLALAAGR